MKKHICGLECEKYCCEIEGHNFEFDVNCKYCNKENNDEENKQNQIETEGESKYEFNKERDLK